MKGKVVQRRLPQHYPRTTNAVSGEGQKAEVCAGELFQEASLGYTPITRNPNAKKAVVPKQASLGYTALR